MVINLSINELIHYISLKKSNNETLKKRDLITFINMLDSYSYMKILIDVLEEHNIPITHECYHIFTIFSDDKDEIKKCLNILLNRYRNKRVLNKFYNQLIFLSGNMDEAIIYIEEARTNGINLNLNLKEKFNSYNQIRVDRENYIQSVHKDNINKQGIVYEYSKLKKQEIDTLSEKDLFHLIDIKDDNEDFYKARKYTRSIYIKELAKKFASGICQLCRNPAPFNDKNRIPFLEVHHIEYLSQGGADEINNVVALCPNCHKKMHILEDYHDKRNLLFIANKQLEKVT